MYYYKYINPPHEEFFYQSPEILVIGEEAEGDHRYFVPCDPPISPPPTIEQIRKKRNGLLLQTDWTQLPDAPLTRTKREEYQTYRQALRDITTQDPMEVVFPSPPA